jgi:hypothetical protein
VTPRAAAQVHAYTAVQALLKSAHRPLRMRAAALAGGCLNDGAARPNLFGALLGALLRPAAAVLDALRWALREDSSGRGALRAPLIALHVRAMSGARAPNLSTAHQRHQLTNALRCFSDAAGGLAAAARTGARLDAPVRAVLVSSSPHFRTQLLDAARDSAVLRGTQTIVFDWRAFLAQASAATRRTLEQSELQATDFCRAVSVSRTNYTFRCNRSEHLTDWGPDPHWVAVVELLLASSARELVIGGGFPYFKVCNTFTQIAAALADTSPSWLCRALGEELPRCRARPVRLQCASRRFSTDWGSSAWRMVSSVHAPAAGASGSAADEVIDCGEPRCMPTPLQPELWADMVGGACSADPMLLNAPVVKRVVSG